MPSGWGSPRSFGSGLPNYRSEAWLAGHYPGISASPPTADIVVANVNGLTVDFSAAASSDNAIMIAYDYDYGDGSTRNWGDTVTYSYGSAGTYTASVTVTDGEGLRDTAQVQVTVGGVAVIQFVVNATDPIVVDEGGNTTFTVNLSSAPTGTVNVTIARDSGDTDLAISGSATLGFSDLNWNNPHTVTIAAAQDADTVSGTAVFSVRASGLPTFLLDVRENDDDAPFTLTVGNASAMPGQSVDIPLTLSNPDAALIRSVSVTLSYDEVALGVPTFTRGIGIPGPAWWNFSATYPAVGTQIIAGNEIAQPDGVAVDDIIAIDTFAVPGATSPSIYDIIVTASDIDGRPATQIVAGTLTVSNPADGGATSDGGPIGGDSVSPADADVMPGDLNQVADTDVSGSR